MSTAATTVPAVRPLVVDGIPWQRAGRPELRARVAGALDRHDDRLALLLLLRDADDWWDAPPVPLADAEAALAAPTLREAAGRLGLGRVGDYFAYRWSDPTYLAALALLRLAWPAPGVPVVEVACGLGHTLRELAGRGVTNLLGLDVAYPKLWLARRFVCPQARYACVDAASPWPLPPGDGPRLVACHDAFYFLADKPAVAARMLAAAGPAGTVAVSHAHNAEVETLSSGEPCAPDAYAALFPGAVLYDDEECTRAFLDGRPPRAGGPFGEAVGWVAGPVSADGPDLRRPPAGRPLRRNPLYDAAGVLRWPSERYRDEYAARSAAYLPQRWPTGEPAGELVRRRLLLDLPEQW